MRIACLLMAAGAGSRFGGCKQLTPIEGKPLVRHSLETLGSIFDKDLFIVLGARREQVLPVVKDVAQVIEHTDWQEGLGSSISRGIRGIEMMGCYDGILLALADQLRLNTDHFNQLIDGFDGDHIVSAYYEGRPGVPAIFPSSLFEDLKQLDNDWGAKSILIKMHQEITSIALPAATIDIDTPADIEQL